MTEQPITLNFWRCATGTLPGPGSMVVGLCANHPRFHNGTPVSVLCTGLTPEGYVRDNHGHRWLLADPMEPERLPPDWPQQLKERADAATNQGA